MNQYMGEALQEAAQCWCDDETSDKQMDVALAEAFAKRLAVLMETAAMMSRNADLCENEGPNLREIWAAADKKAKDWRDAGEEKLLWQMLDAREGLKSLGWRDGQYAPKDGTRFLSIESGSTGVFPCYWMDNNLMAEGGGFWIEAHGDLWPATPTLWKPMSSNA